jgi:hypothetical protein
MTAPASKIEESHEVRKKRRMRILQETFADSRVVEDVRVDFAGNITGEIIKVYKKVWDKELSVAYVEYCVTRGQRYDEMHIQYPPMEPIGLEALEKFTEAGVLKIAYDMPEIVVVVHYEHDKVNPEAEEEYTEVLQTSGRMMAVQSQMDKLAKEVAEAEQKKVRE